MYIKSNITLVKIKEITPPPILIEARCFHPDAPISNQAAADQMETSFWSQKMPLNLCFSLL